MITVDVTDGPRPTVGDEVELWGKALPVEQVAENAGTIPYELLCGVSQRVRLDVI
jgi:alanine racemase